MSLNGLTEGQAAGAEIEYKDSTEDGEDFTLKTTLDSFTLKKSKYKLNLKKGSLVVGDFDIKAEESLVECQKDPTLFDFENIDALKNGCLNQIFVQSKKIKVRDDKENTAYFINLESMNTMESKIVAKLPRVIISDDEKAIFLNNIEMYCSRLENDEFYNLHQVIPGCLDSGVFRISSISSTGVSQSKNPLNTLSSWFEEDQNPQSDYTVSKIIANIKDGEVLVNMKMRVKALPHFKVRVKGSLVHSENDKVLKIKIKDYKAFKVFREGWFSNLVLKGLNHFFVSPSETLKVEYPYIYFYL